MTRRFSLFFLAACHTTDPSGTTEPALGSLTVSVVDRSDGDAPVPDVPCAFDAPTGERAEATTDATGTVRFSDVDWSAGTASVVCETPVGAFAYAGFTDEGDASIAWPISLGESAPPTVVTVDGSFLGAQAPGNYFLVQSTAGPGAFQNIGPDYALDVLADTPFDLIATEFSFDYSDKPHGIVQDMLGWAVVPADALTADATIDIDFAVDGVAPVVANGTLGRPPAGGPLDAADVIGALYVTPSDPSLYFSQLVGFVSQSWFTDDGRLAFSAEAIHDLFADDEVVTVFTLAGADAGSYLLVEGYPQDGDSAESFLDAPTLLDLPEYPTLTTPFAWDAAGAQPIQVAIYDASGHSYLVQWPAGATELTIPPLPAGSTLLTGSRAVGQFVAVDGTLGALYHRLSYVDVLFFL